MTPKTKLGMLYIVGKLKRRALQIAKAHITNERLKSYRSTKGLETENATS